MSFFGYKTALVAVASLMGVWVIACGSDDSGPSGPQADGGTNPNDSVGVEQVSGTCPQSAATLKGDRRTDESCASAMDCSPVCCDCDAAPDKKWLAAACVASKCANKEETCKRTTAAERCQ